MMKCSPQKSEHRNFYANRHNIHSTDTYLSEFDSDLKALKSFPITEAQRHLDGMSNVNQTQDPNHTNTEMDNK